MDANDIIALETINKDLAKIFVENGWVILLYTEFNASTLEDGMKQLSTATVCIWISVVHGLLDWHNLFPAC